VVDKAAECVHVGNSHSTIKAVQKTECVVLHVPLNSVADRLLRRLWDGVIEERLQYLQHVAAIAQHVSLSDQRGARRHRLARVQRGLAAPSSVSRVDGQGVSCDIPRSVASMHGACLMEYGVVNEICNRVVRETHAVIFARARGERRFAFPCRATHIVLLITWRQILSSLSAGGPVVTDDTRVDRLAVLAAYMQPAVYPAGTVFSPDCGGQVSFIADGVARYCVVPGVEVAPWVQPDVLLDGRKPIVLPYKPYSETGRHLPPGALVHLRRRAVLRWMEHEHPLRSDVHFHDVCAR
jgi:hypothetical protein